ncbi:AfsR/SARP family transcriptional regulator [Phytomonospora endophytica]|uniref:DNA-binding SARP family transcriptional activator/DNA-binding transcriptional ArsR family regulator n=1 Tax=Phytomonospora endophytica TaxID=714109 RepID=A0A841FKU7_9ACTN|nr:AfsR/SARP family transcriptional regulator [Phytomonospora endophytica]MBB6034182.1 DNA-binding SARP family transcriptional activator/DNA-binding transcriptional ArsR family regulator [Phytomonospora endophytica]GIG66574.1 SARP family transcriptional regulator [Phytomonospora endophytica]
MLIRLIGPVTIAAVDSTTRIGAPKRACVLAVLAAEPGVPVSQRDLIDRVWNGEPPETVTSVLYSYIARLRAELRPAGATIDRAGQGYLLAADADAVDLHRLRALAAKAATADGEALELWRRACALAQGEPLAGIGGRWAEEFRATFDRERSGLFASRYAAELAAGRHAAVVDELAALVADRPLAEPLVGHLMLALYRSGRPAEALHRFEATRIRLRDELGADPSPELRGLHKRVLGQDLGLSTRAGGASVAPAQLPADIATYTGRDADLAALSSAAARGRTILVTGQAGAGKTALSVHWGHANRASFPDGQLYINLRGFDRGDTVTPGDALARLLHAVGVTDVPADVDHAAEVFRAHTNGRRMLVVLDNAGTAAQVRPLMPGTGCLTVVTSRDRLPGLVAVDDAVAVALGVLARPDSIRLLRRILGEVGDADADGLAGLCGDLPLALRIAAANVAGGVTGGIGPYVRDLADRDRLALLSVDGDPDATVTAALDQSYAALDPAARALFCRIGATPGEDASVDLIAAVSGEPTETAERLLRRLVQAHLVDEYRPGRYRTHDLVRLYAAARAEAELGEAGVAAVADMFIDWHFAHRLDNAVAEEANLFRACDTLREHPRVWNLVSRFMDAVDAGRFLDRVDELATLGLRSAVRADDAHGVFQMQSLRANWLRTRGESAAAIELGRHIIDLAADLTDLQMMVAVGNQGRRHKEAGKFPEAVRLLSEGIELAAQVGRPYNEVSFTCTLVQVLVRRGEVDRARKHVDRIEAIDITGGPGSFLVQRLLARAEVEIASGDVVAALDVLGEVIATAESASPPYHQRWCYFLGTLLVRAGRADLARTVYEANLAYLRSMPTNMAHLPGTLCYYAEALNELGEHTRALELVAEAEGLWQLKPPYAGPLTDLVLAKAHNGLGEHERALPHARSAAAAYGAMPALDQEAESLRAVETARAGLAAWAREHPAAVS